LWQQQIKLNSCFEIVEEIIFFSFSDRYNNVNNKMKMICYYIYAII